MQIGQMTYISENGVVTGPEGSARLTPREQELLEYLIDNKGKSVTRKELLTAVWQWENVQDVKTKTVDVHIGRLRTKLAAAGIDPTTIRTFHGNGYCLEEVESSGDM